MAIRVKHFASKTIDTAPTFDVEAIITEVFIIFFCGVFAYIGYKAKIALLLLLNLIAAVAATLAALYSIYEYLSEKRRVNKISKSK
ncbi:hypothetical protein [uncultured Pseudoteredinibacter sp.]|uniref:hypothetical protein n=1 Tax=uncultured Pseudoteredinibacter sp. TaxID=1641701 RepID=UPI0026094B78|nr:hypothetical protein [uncultured Pseudoteredinibacter sp.]